MKKLSVNIYLMISLCVGCNAPLERYAAILDDNQQHFFYPEVIKAFPYHMTFCIYQEMKPSILIRNGALLFCKKMESYKTGKS